MMHVIATIMGTFRALARKCPVCKRTQLVPMSSKGKTVPCKFCGSDVPPPSKEK